ncbi:hypothetical protein ACU4GD_15380 [Cupriavidus basilensis]
MTLSGTQARHSFELKTAGALHDKPMQLTLAGQGAWQGQAGWNGTIRTLEERGTVNVRLIAPAQLLVADQHVRLGAAGLQFERARVNVDSFEFDHGRIRTQGNLDGLQVANLLRLAEALSGEAPPVRSDLVLDGRWNITLAETASGFAELRRRSGDVSVSAGRGFTTLGLGERRVARRVCRQPRQPARRRRRRAPREAGGGRVRRTAPGPGLDDGDAGFRAGGQGVAGCAEDQDAGSISPGRNTRSMAS